MSKVVESFGKYVLLERLAAGGMAEVYLAKSTGASGINKFVAIKRILPQYSDNPEFIEMFKEEAKIAVNLNHGNVVSIFDFGIEKKQFFLVMEYVEGQNLRQVLNHLKKDTKYFSIDQIVYMVKEVAAGLDHAHRCLDGTTGKPLNITHRDMSPQNIMVSFEGEVKVVDFGIAKAESQMEHTRAGTIKGKFGYMSPEQAEGHVVDLRTDIFSLGIVLWELLANDRLFTSNSEAGTLRKIRECQIPSLRKLNPAVPPELERICNKALAKDKSLRYQTSAAFHRDLNRFLNTQYPEFSAHDFSVFMKSAFSQMFIENRKKLIEFAKVQNVSDDRTTVTATATMTNTNEIHDPKVSKALMSEDAEALGITPNSNAKVDLSELKTKSRPVSRLTPTFTTTNAINNAGTHSQIRKTNVVRKSGPPMWLYVFLGVILAGAGYYMYGQQLFKPAKDVVNVAKTTEPTAPPKNPAKESVAETGTIESASRQLYVVTIESQPIGARITINGEDTGMLTPARRTVEANSELKIALKKEGYQYYERTEVISKNGFELKATLVPLPRMGYVSIDVINGGPSPVVYINDQRIAEKPPIKYYAVPAGTQVKISAVNPFSQLRADQTIVVGYNQKRQVNLILSRAASK